MRGLRDYLEQVIGTFPLPVADFEGSVSLGEVKDCSREVHLVR